jgi:hypothetical protein
LFQSIAGDGRQVGVHVVLSADRVGAVPTALAARISGPALPVPSALASDLVASLDYPMTANGHGLRKLVPEPAGGLLGVDEAMIRALAGRGRRPVTELADPHHLADTDPDWAGGDMARLRELTPSLMRPAFGLLPPMPGPVTAAVRTGLDTLTEWASKLNPL